MVDNDFDILTYLNDMYIMRNGPQIDVNHAGGFHNRYDDNNNVDKNILEINKKRIHIPNARITNFSIRQQENIKEYNESETDSSGDEQTKQNGKRYNETFDERKQERSNQNNPLKQDIIQL